VGLREGEKKERGEEMQRALASPSTTLAFFSILFLFYIFLSVYMVDKPSLATAVRILFARVLFHEKLIDH
jgi:hypothetical protein